MCTYSPRSQMTSAVGNQICMLATALELSMIVAENKFIYFNPSPLTFTWTEIQVLNCKTDSPTQ